MMKLSRMADNVLAAFVSWRFSWDFFFFLAWRGSGWGLSNGLGMILALSGIRISGACDIRRPTGRLYSESRDGSGRRGGTVMTGSGTSSWIIFMDGARSSPVPPSGGRRINIVYTESWLTDREPKRLLVGSDRESRGPVWSCSCESGASGGRTGVGETSGIMLTSPGRLVEYGSRITFSDVHLCWRDIFQRSAAQNE